VNLLVQQLKAAIDELAKKKGLSGARVLDKVNRYGEIVIALILPRDPPGGGGGPRPGP
jgi:hypothetical protein